MTVRATTPVPAIFDTEDTDEDPFRSCGPAGSGRLRRAVRSADLMANADRRLALYGLAHCSTCQKAQAALEDAGWTVDFRDVKDAPLAQAEREGLLADFGDKLINRASLTWRAMSETERAEDPVKEDAVLVGRRTTNGPIASRSTARATFGITVTRT